MSPIARNPLARRARYASFVRASLAAVCALVALLVARPAAAHKPSDAYLFLDVRDRHVSARWDVALRDLDDAHGLDRDENGEITWGEVKYRTNEVSSVTWSKLEVLADGAVCTRSSEAPPATTAHTDGAYLVLRAELDCPGVTAPEKLEVRYSLFFERDPQHRGIVRLDARGVSRSLVFSTRERASTIDLTDRSAGLRAFFGMVREGISHIAQGYDHLLFLFALLFPAVFVREAGKLVPVARFRPALMDVLRVVTAFTIAHSVTLSLAALDVVRMPSRVVESVIAASVILAAVNNVKPLFPEGRWAAAFVLGLMHGFGFSATLDDLELSRGALVTALFGFNVGVEAGQLAVVALFLPLAFAARRTRAYRRGVLVYGSVGIALLASVWFVERAFAIAILPK
jgi:hypothetical protein